MRSMRTSGRAGGSGTFHRAQRVATGQALNIRGQEAERSLVGRFFLHPEKLTRIAMLCNNSFQFRLRNRKELLHKDDRRPRIAAPLALPPQLMADLTGAENDSLAIADLRVLNYALEAAGAQVAQRTSCIRMPQHPFGSEDNERLAPGTQGLPAQQVKILSCRRWLADLNVVLCGKLQISLNAPAGMFRSLAFIAVRQEHHHSGKQSPFVLSGHNKLINDDLCAVGEIAELCFPKHQRVRIVAAEAVFESQHRCLRQDGIVGLKPGLPRRKMA